MLLLQESNFANAPQKQSSLLFFNFKAYFSFFKDSALLPVHSHDILQLARRIKTKKPH